MSRVRGQVDRRRYTWKGGKARILWQKRLVEVHGIMLLDAGHIIRRVDVVEISNPQGADRLGWWVNLLVPS